MLLADISMKTIVQKIRKHNFAAATVVLGCFVVVYMCWPTSLRMNQLPLPARPLLVGREDRIHKIEDVLLNDNYNIIFILGPPGVGKSAVAITIGYDFVSKHSMKVLYVDMEDLENKNLETFMTDKLGAENWAEKLSMKVLLILDNCDKHTIDPESLRRLHKQIDKWVHDTTMLTILVTNQVKVPWPIYAPYMSLKYLSADNTNKLLLQKRILQITKAEDVTTLQEIIDGMPLAVENIAIILQSSTSPGLQSLLSSFKKPHQAIKVFDSKHLVHVTHSVSTSISSAYNKIQDNDKECAWHLIQKYGAEEFDDSAANTAFKQLGGTSDYDECISNLVQAQLLITRTGTVKNEEPDCYIHGTKFLISCNNPKSSKVNYHFHPLIASYIHVKTKQRGTGILNTNYQHFVETGLQRTYCPHQYMYVRCDRSWVVATSGMLDRMASKHVQFNERVQIGVLATYWNRVIFKGIEFSSKSYRDVSTFINMTLATWKPKYENTPDLLAAYVFYNHASLRITWETKNGQHQCFCPDPKEAVKKMMPRKKYVDYLYSQISNNHMAWSASRSFYLDLTCCCRALGECEHRWRYWIKGIVSQTATARMFFQDVMKSKCSDNIEHLPPKVPVIIEGLWHYAFTKEKDKAAEILEEYLQQHDCPILKLAAIMVLHDIYHDTENEECDVALGNHINNSSDLIDTSIAYYKRFYREVIIPFLHEIGKNKIATELASMLSSPPPKTAKLVTEKTFECELIHKNHLENFHKFFCLTL